MCVCSLYRLMCVRQYRERSTPRPRAHEWTNVCTVRCTWLSLSLYLCLFPGLSLSLYLSDCYNCVATRVCCFLFFCALSRRQILVRALLRLFGVLDWFYISCIAFFVSLSSASCENRIMKATTTTKITAAAKSNKKRVDFIYREEVEECLSLSDGLICLRVRPLAFHTCIGAPPLPWQLRK